MNRWRKGKKRLGGGVATVTGICKFCGQMATRKVLEEWGRRKLTNWQLKPASVRTRGSTRIRKGRKKGQKERADARITLLFGKENKSVTVPDAAVDLLHKAVYPVCEGFIQSITVDIGDGVKGKINITSKGIVKVARTKTDTSTYEA